MQINSGGLLDIKDVIGRDEDIARHWQILETCLSWQLVS